MTKRQASTLIASILALIVTQVLCFVVMLRGQEQIHKSNLAIQQLISGADDSAATTHIEGGAAVPPGSNDPAPAVAPATPASPPLRMVFPEEDIRNTRQRIETLKAELHQAQAQLDKLMNGDH